MLAAKNLACVLVTLIGILTVPTLANVQQSSSLSLRTHVLHVRHLGSSYAPPRSSRTQSGRRRGDSADEQHPGLERTTPHADVVGRGPAGVSQLSDDDGADDVTAAARAERAGLPSTSSSIGDVGVKHQRSSPATSAAPKVLGVNVYLIIAWLILLYLMFRTGSMF